MIQLTPQMRILLAVDIYLSSELMINLDSFFLPYLYPFQPHAGVASRTGNIYLTRYQTWITRLKRFF